MTAAPPEHAVRVEGIEVTWSRRRELFPLDRDVIHLNHGSFGAVPIPVQRAHQRLRDEMDANPMAFFTRGLLDRLRHTRRHLAGFVGADPDGVALVPNVTAAVQVVLGSLDLRPGDEIVLTDHGYGAVRLAAARTAAEKSATVRDVALPLAATADDVVDRVTPAVTPGKTRLVIIDHVASTTAKLLPVDRVVQALRAHDIPILVDAAHAPGMLEIDVATTGADFWCGNLHKWAFAPRPTALLAVAPRHRSTMRSLVVSWEEHHGYPAAQEFGGTLDYTTWLAAPAGVHLLRTLGPERVRTHNADLAAHGQRVVASAVARVWPHDPGSRRREELELARTGLLGDPSLSMRLVPMPPGVAEDRPSAVALRTRLATAHGVEVALDAWRGCGYLRLSAQIYNRAEDYARLAHALVRELRAA
jgi:isopenicillin-N epimerase